MKGFVRVLAAGISIASIGCAKTNLIEERKRTQAPASKADLGIVIEDASTQEIEFLLDKNPSAKVRVLSAQHGLYEVFGVTKDQAQTETKGRATENTYFEFKTQGRPLPGLAQIPGFAPCQDPEPGKCPDAQLVAVSPTNLNQTTIDIDTKIKISGTASPGRKNAVIMIGGPAASKISPSPINASETEFTLDALGLYQVFLVVQDEAGFCSADAIRFLVTANRPYEGAQTAALPLDLSKLSQIAAVSAESAWRVSKGQGELIAIIDTGVAYNHSTLAANMDVNEKEIPGNGLDDDGNGVADDVVGYDFVNDDGFPYDDDSHGTHVAGLAASKDFGLAPNAKILAVKALSSLGGDAGSIAAAIRYSADRGARIINMSLGAPGAQAHPAIVSAVAYAETKNSLIITAAGNGDEATGLGFDIDQQSFFPASLPNENILTVAAFDSNNDLTVYSNFGKNSVDVVAPGGGPDDLLLSAAYENPHGQALIGMVGTSMATPIVSGIAADVLSAFPHLTNAQLKQILMSAGKEVASLKDVTRSGRHIDALSALDIANQQNVLF